MRIIKKDSKGSKSKLNGSSFKAFEFEEFKIQQSFFNKTAVKDVNQFLFNEDAVSKEKIDEKSLEIERIENDNKDITQSLSQEVMGSNFEKDKNSIFLKLKEEGYKEGWQQGYNEALEKFRREFDLLSQFRVAMEDHKKEIIKKAEPEILKLSQYIAEKIVRQKIKLEPNLIISTINFAVKQISSLGKLIIYLNPEDYEYLKSNKEEIKDIIESFDDVKFLEDKRVEKGGCIIETENGNIDTQPSSQFKIVNRVLFDNVENKFIQ